MRIKKENINLVLIKLQILSKSQLKNAWLPVSRNPGRLGVRNLLRYPACLFHKIVPYQ